MLGDNFICHLVLSCRLYLHHVFSATVKFLYFETKPKIVIYYLDFRIWKFKKRF